MDTQENVPHTGSNVPPENVFLLIPNLVGYARISLAVLSLYFMPIHPRTCSILYSVSCLLDAIDGMLARKFNQSTQFGAILDMTIDRCTTSCLLVFLAVAYPRWSIQSHKKIDKNRPWVMRIYYSNVKVLFTVCAFNELFFITLYLLSFSTNMPARAHPNGLADGTRTESANFDISQAILWFSGAFMIFKQYVNIIQMLEACKWIAEGDVERRKQMRAREMQ